MSKLSDKLKKMFSKTKGANYPAKFEQTAFKAGQKTRSLFKGKKKADVFSKSKDLVTASAAKKLRKLGKLSKVAKLARIATPIGLGTVAAQAIYQTANPSKEAKAKIKAAKKKMSKITTKQAHADLLKNSAKTGKMMKASLGLLAMRKAKKKGAKGVELLSPAAMATRFFNKGGDIMLTGKQKKLDKDGDGKISGNDFKMMKARYGTLAKSNVKEGLKKSAKDKAGLMKFKTMAIKKMSGAAISEAEYSKLKDMMPKITDSGSVREAKKNAIQTKISKFSVGGEPKSTQGYGAARTQGEGLQDENLIPGKSMDYYKDIV